MTHSTHPLLSIPYSELTRYLINGKLQNLNLTSVEIYDIPRCFGEKSITDLQQSNKFFGFDVVNCKFHSCFFVYEKNSPKQIPIESES